MVDIPEHLLKRSQDAKARALGQAVPTSGPEEKAAPVEEAPAAPPPSSVPPPPAPPVATQPAAPVPAPVAGGVATAVAAPPRPSPAAAVAAANTAPARTQRLLAVVKAGSIQQTKKDPVDKVNTWPHLLIGEFVSLLMVSAGLIIFSILVNAPLQAKANPNLTPNPSKAPWYFLGLQELLKMFHPMVAGVTIPGIGIFGLIAVPYIDRNSATKPAERKFAIAIFTFFMMYWAILVMFGSFFRGPGFNFVWPWQSGIFFDF